MFSNWPKSKTRLNHLVRLIECLIAGYQESTVSRSKREIRERKTVGKASLLSGKNKVLVGFFHMYSHIEKLHLCLVFKTLLLSQSCDTGSRCVVLECPLQGLDGTTVKLRSRVWNSTFIEVKRCFKRILASFLCYFTQFLCFLQDYASLPHLDIIVRASIVLHSQAKNIILTTPDANVSGTSQIEKIK